LRSARRRSLARKADEVGLQVHAANRCLRAG
jgi:hypothetical protein